MVLSGHSSLIDHLEVSLKLCLDWSHGIITSLPLDQQLYQKVKVGWDSKIMAGPLSKNSYTFPGATKWVCMHRFVQDFAKYIYIFFLFPECNELTYMWKS